MTPTPYIPDLKIQFLNVAKPRSRLKAIITYSGVISSQVGLWLPEGTDLFPGDAAPPPTCGLACWDVGSTATISADIWINSTWKQGQVILFNLFWQKALQGPQREYWDEWIPVIVGGGTPWTPTPTRSPTPTRTPVPPEQVITVKTGEWVRLENPRLSTYLYYWSEGPGPICACAEEIYVDGRRECSGVDPSCRGLCGRVWFYAGDHVTSCSGFLGCGDGSHYGWNSINTYHASSVWLYMDGWGELGYCGFRITQVKTSNTFLSTKAEIEGL